MLEVTKNASIQGNSMIDGVVAATFYGSVGSNAYMNMQLGNMDAYMANMTEVLKDQQDFMNEYQELKELIEPQLVKADDKGSEDSATD